jgi:hypothetical protein
MRLRGAALTIVAALCAAGSAQAAPRALLYGESLSQPTALAGETVVGAVQTAAGRSRYSVLSFGASGPPTRLFRADVTPSGGDEFTQSAQFGYAASETHLALLHVASATTPQAIASRTALGFGARSGLPLLPGVFDCEAEGAPAPPAYVVDGARVAVITADCGPARLLVHEAGSTRTLPVPAGASDRRLALAGGYVAYEVLTPRGDGFSDSRTVVARTDTGEQVFSVDGFASGFALAPDGTLLLGRDRRAIDRERSCLSAQLFVATPADPAPREVPGAQPCGRVELAGDRAVFTDPQAVLHATTLAGESVVLARGVWDEIEFDGGPGRVAVLMPSCSGAALHTLAVDGSSGEPEPLGTCTARLLSPTARILGRTASVRFACPRGCAGSMALTLTGGSRAIATGSFFATPGRRATARLRLPRPVASRVREIGRRAARVAVDLRLPGGSVVSRTLAVVLRPAL